MLIHQSDKDHLVIQELGLSSVGAQMAGQANPCPNNKHKSCFGIMKEPYEKHNIIYFGIIFDYFLILFGKACLKTRKGTNGHE